MNKILLVKLSFFGLAMALATVFWIPSTFEPFLWLAIFIFCAYLIAKKSSELFFVQGFLLRILNTIWVTAIHILFSTTYLTNHPEANELIASSPLPNSPKLMMLMTGPIIGVISGLILGIFASIAARIVNREQRDK